MLLGAPLMQRVQDVKSSKMHKWDREQNSTEENNGTSKREVRNNLPQWEKLSF